MAIKNVDEIMASARTLIGENTSDDALNFLEDMSDTLNDFDTRTKDNTDWHKKYDENDQAWRKRYADRFNGKRTEEDDEDDSGVDEPLQPKLRYEELFKIGG